MKFFIDNNNNFGKKGGRMERLADVQYFMSKIVGNTRIRISDSQ